MGLTLDRQQLSKARWCGVVAGADGIDGWIDADKLLSSRFAFPDTIVFDPNQNALLISDNNQTVRVIDFGEETSVVRSLTQRKKHNGLDGPRGIACYDWGLVVANYWSHSLSIVRIENGDVVPFQSKIECGSLRNPHCMAKHPLTGDLWVGDESRFRIVVFKRDVLEDFVVD